MEVPLLRSDVDHVTGLHDVAGFPAGAHTTTPAHTEQELAAGVAVPVGSGSRREVHDPDVRRLIVGERRAQPYLAREPSVVAPLEGAFVRS